MNKIVIILLFFIPYILFAQGITIDVIDKNLCLIPGKPNSLVFKVSNFGDNSISINPKIILPKEWTIINEFPETNLNKYESKIFITTINIPIFTLSNKYDIGFIVTNSDNKIIAEIKTPFLVEKLEKISLESISQTNYIKAGDTIYSTFNLRNEGNTENIINLSTSEGTFIDGDSIALLLPGESRIIKALYPTNKKQIMPSQNTIKVIATMENNSSKTVSALQFTNIIPAQQVDEDTWLRFPIRINTFYTGIYDYEKYKSGMQFEILGSGYINEENTKQIEFRAITQNQIKQYSFSPYEEYFINYKTPSLFIHFGDKVFSSSTLTELSRYGRGIELNKSFNKFSIGGFYNNPKFYNNIKNETNFFLKYNFTPHNNLKYGYLNKKMENDGSTINLNYLSGEGIIFDKINYQGEFAFSENNKENGTAYLIQTQGIFKSFNFNINYVYSSPNYKGYYTDTSIFNSYINYQLNNKLRLFSNFQKDAKNIERDSLYSTAPYRNNLQMGLRYNYSKNGIAIASFGNLNFEDKMINKQFNFSEKYSKIELIYNFNKVILNLQASLAKTENYINNTTKGSSFYNANIGYNYKENSFNIYSSYSKTNRYNSKNNENFIFGGNINLLILNKLSTSLLYQNDYSPEEYYLDRNLFEFSLNYKLSNKQQINLLSRYTLLKNQFNTKDLYLSLRYTLDINAPIKKIINYGSLKGKILSLNDTNIENIKINLGPYTTFTDIDGNFIFKNIKPTNYFLDIEQETLNFKDITDIITPINIKINEGENKITFGLTKSATINGFFNIDQLSEIPLKQHVILEITSNEETYRKIYDITKPFDFSHLRPGNWKIKILRNGLNPKYNIETEEIDLTINPNEKIDITIKITETNKEIKYLQNPIKVGF